MESILFQLFSLRKLSYTKSSARVMCPLSKALLIQLFHLSIGFKLVYLKTMKNGSVILKLVDFNRPQILLYTLATQAHRQQAMICMCGILIYSVPPKQKPP